MRILIATNGSKQSDVAIHLGALIISITGGVIVLVTIISREQEREQATAILSRAESLIRPKAPSVEKIIRKGRPAEQILRVARENQLNLIVVGDSYRSRLGPRILGPTTEQVIEKKPCPVLIARGVYRPLERVLLCESGRDPTLLSRLLNLSSPLVTAFKELTVLHVMSQIAASPGAHEWELEANADELIEKRAPEGEFLGKDLELLESSGLKYDAKVRHGLVVESILDEAKCENYDLVVIGAHIRAGWERYLLDDIAHEVVQKLDRPVLII